MSRPAGYTLLEVLIATGILVVGLAAVFGVTRLAQRKSITASDLAVAQLEYQAILNENLAKQDLIKPFAPRPLDKAKNWLIALNIYPSPQPGLAVLHLSAQKFSQLGNIIDGPPYHLVRWIPQHRVQLPNQQNAMTESMEFDDPYR